MGFGFLCIFCVILFNVVWLFSVIFSGFYVDLSKVGKIFNMLLRFFFLNISNFIYLNMINDNIILIKYDI